LGASQLLHDLASDCVAVARREVEDGHHQDLEALVLQAALVEACHRSPEEIHYIAHVFSPFSDRHQYKPA
jgi:hypothetical protein